MQFREPSLSFALGQSTRARDKTDYTPTPAFQSAGSKPLLLQQLHMITSKRNNRTLRLCAPIGETCSKGVHFGLGIDGLLHCFHTSSEKHLPVPST